MKRLTIETNNREKETMVRSNKQHAAIMSLFDFQQLMNDKKLKDLTIVTK